MYVRTENGDLPRVEEGNTGSTPVYSTMQEELGVVANSLGRTAIRLFEESYFQIAPNIT